ncbi:MAG TPA: trigger factor [Candidatus Nitrosopolaris sp.]|nr:trigger factor [Candidatus Nitrosopolaris sp.]
MQITRTDNSSTNVSLSVSAAGAELEPIKRHVLGRFAGQVKVPGFRAGHAPASVVEKHIDQRALLDEFLNHALNELYRRAVDHQKLRPVGQPKIEVKKFVPFTDLEFSAETDVIGPIILPDYKKIKLAKPKVEISAQDVNEVLKSLRERMAERKPVERPAKNGDEILIDFSGKDSDGQPVAGADGKDYPLILGSNSFIPGFEDNLIGVKAGETKQFTVKFPKNYGVAALQNKDVTFEVDAKKVSELAQPKLDDALAAKAGPFKTLAELKADIKKQLKIERQNQADRDYENQLVQTIADKTTVDIPESLLTEQVLAMEEEEKRNLTYRGQTWQEHLKEEGISEQQHRERNKPVAAGRVKAGLALSEIAEQEGLKVTPEELEIRLQLLKGQYQDPQMRAELDKPENRNDIANRLLTEKTLEKLTDYTTKQRVPK